MEQITENTNGEFDVVNRQSGHVVGTVEIRQGEFISFTPAQLPEVAVTDEDENEDGALTAEQAKAAYEEREWIMRKMREMGEEA